MTESLDERTRSLLVGAHRSVRYHDHRRRFCEIWSAVTVAVATIGASAGVASFLAEASPDWVPAATSVLIAVAGAIDLSVGTHGALTDAG